MTTFLSRPKKLFLLFLSALFLLGCLPGSSVDFNSAEARTKKAVRKKRKARRPAARQAISQIYHLEESPDKDEAEALVAAMKGLGAAEAGVDMEKNVLRVKYSTQKLSALGIIQKLKELGYTTKRIE